MRTCTRCAAEERSGGGGKSTMFVCVVGLDEAFFFFFFIWNANFWGKQQLYFKRKCWLTAEISEEENQQAFRGVASVVC